MALISKSRIALLGVLGYAVTKMDSRLYGTDQPVYSVTQPGNEKAMRDKLFNDEGMAWLQNWGQAELAANPVLSRSADASLTIAAFWAKWDGMPERAKMEAVVRGHRPQAADWAIKDAVQKALDTEGPLSDEQNRALAAMGYGVKFQPAGHNNPAGWYWQYDEERPVLGLESEQSDAAGVIAASRGAWDHAVAHAQEVVGMTPERWATLNAADHLRIVCGVYGIQQSDARLPPPTSTRETRPSAGMEP